MKWDQFITLLSSAAACSLATKAQQREQMGRALDAKPAAGNKRPK
jgi:hypothetical protein